MICKFCEELPTCQVECQTFCDAIMVNAHDHVSDFGVGVNDKEDWPSFIKNQFEPGDRYIIFSMVDDEGVYNISVMRRMK